MLRKNKTIPKILKSFLNYLNTVRGYSNNTIKAYCSDLMQFFIFMQHYKNIFVPVSDFNVFILLQTKESDVIAFLVYLNFNKNNNPYTRQRKLSAIRRFFKWLLSTYPIENKTKNPVSNLESIKKVERIPRHLTLEQAKKIQDIFNFKNSMFPARKLEYINVRYRSQKIIKLNSPLFINRYGKRIGIDAVEDICKNAYKLMELDGLGYTTHTLRHTAASIIYMYVKEDMLLLKQFLGHSNITTTQIYTHISNKNIKEALEKHPLNSYKKFSKIEKIAG